MESNEGTENNMPSISGVSKNCMVCLNNRSFLMHCCRKGDNINVREKFLKLCEDVRDFFASCLLIILKIWLP